MRLALKLTFLFLFISSARAEIEIDEYGSARYVTRAPVEVEDGSDFRRVGLGLMAGGVSGIFGANLEINFTRLTALAGGVGISTDYQSLFLGAKHRLHGERFRLYASGGYAKWYSVGGGGDVGETTPAFVGKRFLSESERRSGIFSENLIYSGLGIQFLKSSGAWAGAAVYAEIVALADLDDLVLEPNAALGYMFYF